MLLSAANLSDSISLFLQTADNAAATRKCELTLPVGAQNSIQMGCHCFFERFFLYYYHCLYPVSTSISDQKDFAVSKYRGFLLSSEKKQCQDMIGGIG